MRPALPPYCPRRVVEGVEEKGVAVWRRCRILLQRTRKDAGLFPDQVTYNMLIHGLAKCGHANEALSFLRELRGEKFLS